MIAKLWGVNGPANPVSGTFFEEGRKHWGRPTRRADNPTNPLTCGAEHLALCRRLPVNCPIGGMVAEWELVRQDEQKSFRR
jgi:hypothetical protein